MLIYRCDKRMMIGGFLSLFVFAMTVFAAEKPPVPEETKQEQLAKKSFELRQIGNDIFLINAECLELLSQYELAQKDTRQKNDTCQKAKNTYLKVSQNADILSQFLTQEQLTQILNDYKYAEEELKASEKRLQEIKNRKEEIEGNLFTLNKGKKEKEVEILGIKAELYEAELAEPIWVEGVGECVADENKTIKECEKVVIECARRDAVEKGGKSLIEAITEVNMFDLTRDEIKKTAKVNIIEQDSSGDFGRVKKTIIGDMIKLTATVRLKIQSVAIYNPYLERMKELQTGEGTTKETGIIQKRISPTSREHTSLSSGESDSPLLNQAKTLEEAAPSKSDVSTRHYIGESYGGGIVFFVDKSGQHGLIAATSDHDTKIQWYDGNYTITGADKNGVYAGQYNTKRIIDSQGMGNYAAQICAGYRGGGFIDWYLPSIHELNLLYSQKDVVGGFNGNYWSSTEYNNSLAWSRSFNMNVQNDSYKSLVFCVRAIRAF